MFKKSIISLVGFLVFGMLTAYDTIKLHGYSFPWPYTSTFDIEAAVDCKIQGGIQNINPLGIFPRSTYGGSSVDIYGYALTIFSSAPQYNYVEVNYYYSGHATVYLNMNTSVWETEYHQDLSEAGYTTAHISCYEAEE